MIAAVYGTGSQGSLHCKKYAQLGLDVIAHDKNPVAYGNVKDVVKKENFHSDVSDFLKAARDVSVVSICVPTDYHLEALMNVGESCLPGAILIEKPLAATLHQAIAMEKYVRDNSLKVTPGHVERYNPVIHALKSELVGAEVWQLDFTRVGAWPRQLGDVGVVLDLATHDLDIFRYLTDLEPESIHARIGYSNSKTEHEDYAIISLSANSLESTIKVNWLTPTRIRKIEATTNKGFYTAHLTPQKLERKKAFKSYTDYADLQRKYNEPSDILFEGKEEPLLMELKRLTEWAEGKAEPLVFFYDGIRALQLAELALKSAASGQVLKTKGML